MPTSLYSYSQQTKCAICYLHHYVYFYNTPQEEACHIIYYVPQRTDHTTYFSLTTLTAYRHYRNKSMVYESQDGLS